MPENPYEPPKTPLAEPLVDEAAVRSVAGAQQWMLLSVLLLPAGWMLVVTLTGGGWLLVACGAVMAAFHLWCVFRLCRVLGKAPPQWLLGACIPVVNLVCLIALSNAATEFQRSRGVRVGLGR